MQRKLLIPIISALGVMSITAQAQIADTTRPISLDEFVISANKFGENKKNVAQPIQVITRQELEWIMPQTTAHMLEQSGNVFVQRSQMGGGSPVLRGFEASRVLMVIDGVRMNNAIYRAGHLQNVITVDNNILETTEVMFGPASTLYGSDALGGVVLFNTIKPKFSGNSKAFTSANAMLRYSTANEEKTGHVDFNIGSKKIASLTSISYSDFSDLRQGNFRNPFYGNFGAREYYAQRINGMDSMVANSDANIQRQSGYSQIDILEKLLYKQNRHITHGLNLQYSSSTDIPRYDRLTEIRNGKLRFAEWYYGPQERMMAAYNFNAVDLPGFFDEIKAGINYQAIEESRHDRGFGKNDLASRTENLNVIGLNADFRRLMQKHELTFGVDAQYNDVKSEAVSRDIITGETSAIDTRYPDGGSSMTYAAVYGQHIYKIIPGKLILNDGIRLNYTSLDASFTDKSFFPFPFTTASQQHIAWSGNLGLVYMPLERWRFSLSGSTGFRAPNIDDLAKVFESSGGVNLVVPNPDLKPEYTYNADLGIIYTANNVVKLEAHGFYTWLRNAIIQDNYTLNGQDSVAYDGAMTAVVANQNKAKGLVYGFSAALTAKLMPNVSLYSTVNFTRGRYFDLTNTEVPLDHIPPVFGKTSIMYNQKRFTGEVFCLYNGWKWLKDYSPSGEDNLTYATPFGMPGWFTLNARVGYKINKYVGAEVALENILDYNYRQFASGISAPGRNLVVTVRGHF